MKSIILTALAAMPALFFAQNNQFDLKGHIGATGNSAMYRSTGKIILDFAALNKGDFEFKGAIASPLKAQLILDHAGVGLKKIGRGIADVLTMYLEKGSIDLTSEDSVKNSTITGSKINTENAAYTKIFAAPEQKMAVVNTEYAAAPLDKKKDPAYRKESEERYDKANEEKKALQCQYIKQNPNSFLNLAALTEVAGPSIDVSQIEPLYKSLSATVTGSESGVEFAKAIESARATSIGAIVPVFTQNDINDKAVNQAGFEGKYVLLEFWASWFVPRRAENLNVVKAYNQYKNKNFSVLRVSLDQPCKEEAWLAAIKADGLNWTLVSDLKFGDNEVAKQYGIRSIPQNFLIDPTRKL